LDADNSALITASTETKSDWQNNQKSIASEKTSHIHLENIHPKDLLTVVAPSGLVSVKQLYMAYKTQVLQTDQSGKRNRTCNKQC
jgi:hypothetical protein